MDEETGRNYEKGYYDENGQHYDSVVFENNGRYENVVCHCSYCDQDTIMNLSTGEISARSLECPNCGASLEIRSALDTIQSVRQSPGIEGRSVQKKRTLPLVLISIVLILAGLTGYGSYLLQKESASPAEFQIMQPDPGTTSEEYPFGEKISLARSGSNAYVVSENSFDKQLVLDPDADSYYDADSDCWVWYNTDVEPAVWQYWYEGISSDFGDYGWMEHDEDGWFIEESYGNWIELPGQYETKDLWYIEE